MSNVHLNLIILNTHFPTLSSFGRGGVYFFFGDIVLEKDALSHYTVAFNFNLGEF